MTVDAIKELIEQLLLYYCNKSHEHLAEGHYEIYRMYCDQWEALKNLLDEINKDRK